MSEATDRKPDLQKSMDGPPDAAKPDAAKLASLLPPGLSNLKKGLRFRAGDVDYQLNRSGIKSKFFYGSAPIDAFIGYRGQYRLEFNGPARGTRVKFGYTAHSDDANNPGGFRLEFSANF